MTNKKTVSRRRFLKTTLQAGTAVGAPYIVPSSVLGLGGATPPSDRISIAGLGIGGRGARDLESFLSRKDVQFRAICDVRNERREAIKSRADKHHGNNDCVMYSDMNDLWARDDIDAVLIATGDRRHTLLSIMTARSGKDVYCEKPCSMTVQESRAPADAYDRLGRIYQAGPQRRSGSNFKYIIDLAKTGKLGNLHTLHANVGPGDRWPPKTSHDWLAAEPLPPKRVVDWDRWLGPCPWRPYNSLYVQGRWRGYFDFYGGGILEIRQSESVPTPRRGRRQERCTCARDIARRPEASPLRPPRSRTDPRPRRRCGPSRSAGQAGRGSADRGHQFHRSSKRSQGPRRTSQDHPRRRRQCSRSCPSRARTPQSLISETGTGAEVGMDASAMP